MLDVVALNQFYGESHVLWDVALSVPAGSCTVLMGRNGVGKTTLLKVIMGLLPASSGAIKFGDEELKSRPAPTRARLGIGYVPQGREIFPQLTVEENLRVGLGIRKGGTNGNGNGNGNGATSSKEIPEKVFRIFPVLKKMLHRRGGDLSGGQQQQLAIGRALTLDPKLLILDEPTEGIQPNIVSEIGDIIMRLNREEGLAVLLVEQKLPFARRVAQQFCLMDRGRTVSAGPMSDLSDTLIQRHLVV